MRNYEIRFIQLLPPGFDVVVRFVFAVSCDNLHFSAFDFNKNNIAAANGGNTLRFIFQIEFDFGVVHSRDCLFKAFVKSLAVYGFVKKSRHAQIHCLVQIMIVGGYVNQNYIGIFL